MAYEQLGATVQNICSLTFAIKNKLKVKYSLESNDVRFTMFNKIINVMEPAMINYYLIDKYLVKKDWWEENGYDLPNDNEMKGKIVQFEYNIGIGLIQNSSYSIESSLRDISRKVQPDACNYGTAEYKSIYASLFKKADIQKHEPLFDLFRNIRNTMHNNGIFYHKSNCDQVVLYNGIEYKFEVGKPCKFATTKLGISLIAEKIPALVEFIESDFISGFEIIKEEWTTSEREANN